MDIEQITAFLGWVSVINIVFLSLSALIVFAIKKPASRMHAKMFGLKEEEVLKAYFYWLAFFEVIVITFNIAPYLALRLMV